MLIVVFFSSSLLFECIIMMAGRKSFLISKMARSCESSTNQRPLIADGRPTLDTGMFFGARPWRSMISPAARKPTDRNKK
jgi:hypothetical protein